MSRFDATSPPLMMISALKTDAPDESEREPQDLPRWLTRSRLTACPVSRRFSRPQLITERSWYCGARSYHEWCLMWTRKRKVRRSRFQKHLMEAKRRNEHLPQLMNSSKDRMK